MNNNDIVSFNIDVMAGLGNQICQLAMVLEYSKKYNKKIVLEDKTNEYKQNNNRDSFDYRMILKNIEVLNQIEYKKIIFNNIYTETNNSIANGHLNIIPFYEGNVLLEGYFQSPYNYSDETIDEITNNIYNYNNNYELALKYYNAIKETSLEFNDDKYLFIHIRRGDFVKYGNRTNIDYIKKGIEVLDGLNKILLIFSDDINWCKKYIKFNNKIIYVDFINNKYIELILMSLIINGIVSPESSYSLWGGLMGKKDKKIVASNYRYSVISEDNHKLLNDKNERYPKEWIKLDLITTEKLL